MSRIKRKKELDSPVNTDVRFGTPKEVAEYRAERLKGYDTIIEVGAGAGFQTEAFAHNARVVAIDIDAERLGRANLPENVTPIAGDALDPGVMTKAKSAANGKTAVFLDPERPPSSKSRTLDEIKPDINKFIMEYSGIAEDIAIELPPFLNDIPAECEREFLSVEGKLNRLTVYFGELKRCDVSVVRLPSKQRVEHNGPLPYLEETSVRPRFIGEPDAALTHAGLTPLALPQRYQGLPGRKPTFLLEEEHKHPFLKLYRIVASGEKKVRDALIRCNTLVLHGDMSPQEQREMLRSLNRFCKGRARMHLFPDWHLAITVE
jgi:hypothetical protein